MKRFLALLLAVLMIFALTACGGDGDKDVDNDKGDKKDDGGKVDSGDITFENAVIFDNELLYLEIRGIDPDGDWGYTLKAHIENRSEDTNITVFVDNASVNGVSCDPAFGAEVAPGKQANEEISISPESFAGVDIGRYTDIALHFSVLDSDDIFSDSLAEDTAHIYPYGEENATVFVREAQDSDIVLIDNEYVTAVVTGFGIDDIWGYTVYFYYVNKTDNAVMFAVEDCSVNDCMADPFYAHYVSAGTCSLSSMSFNEVDFDNNNITEVEKIEFRFSSYNAEEFADDYFNEIVILNP